MIESSIEANIRTRDLLVVICAQQRGWGYRVTRRKKLIYHESSFFILIIRELFHLSTMVIHLGHVFISLMLMLYGPKLGCVGKPWSIWCFGLIIALMHSILII